MKVQKKYILWALALIVLGILLTGFPFLFKKEFDFKEMDFNDGKAVVVSDLHLDSNPRDLTCVGDYLNNENVSLLILNGDVFDKKHKDPLKKEDLDYVKERLGIEDGSSFDIIYLLSSYNHDPYLKLSKDFKEENVDVLESALALKTGNEKFYIFHGDYILSGYNTGIASIVNKLSANLLYEKFAKIVINEGKDNWVILSHSHVPGINQKAKVANTGSWINRFVSSKNTAVLIEVTGGQKSLIDLVKIPCD